MPPPPFTDMSATNIFFDAFLRSYCTLIYLIFCLVQPSAYAANYSGGRIYKTTKPGNNTFIKNIVVEKIVCHQEYNGWAKKYICFAKEIYNKILLHIIGMTSFISHLKIHLHNIHNLNSWWKICFDVLLFCKPSRVTVII